MVDLYVCPVLPVLPVITGEAALHAYLVRRVDPEGRWSAVTIAGCSWVLETPIYHGGTVRAQREQRSPTSEPVD